MKKTSQKILFGIISALFLGLFMVLSAVALTPSDASADVILSPGCVNLTHNMYYGTNDYYTGGDVSRLQSFLNSRGLMSIGATGYFGPITLGAVQKFQSKSGLYSAGYVGTYTRAKILEISCGGPTYPPVNAPYIYSLYPQSGAIGTLVTISGANFSGDSTILFDSSPISTYPIPTFAAQNNQIAFVIPSSVNPPCYYTVPQCLAATKAIVPGNYTVQVRNSNGTSNSVTFTVTGTGGGYGNHEPVITGIDAPSSLVVDQAGTWTVHATDVTGGVLSYSVVWGDEGYMYPMMTASPAYENRGQNASFTHTYHSKGTFTPRFTVTGSNGLTANTSATITIIGNGGGYNQAPYIYSINPTSGRIGTYVTLYGTGLSANNTVLFGTGRIDNVSPAYGGGISFVIPDSTSPDCQPGMFCAQFFARVIPGTYPIRVRNNDGTSNSVSFYVY